MAQVDSVFGDERDRIAQASGATLGGLRRWPAVSIGQVLRIYTLIELAGAAACALLAEFIYIDGVRGDARPDAPYMAAALTYAVLQYAVFRQMKLYRNTSGPFQPHSIGRCLQGVAITFGLMVFVGFSLRIANEFSRVWLFMWFILASSFVAAARGMLHRLLGQLAKRGYFRQLVAFVGEPQDFQRLFPAVLANIEVEIAGFYAGVPQVKAPTDQSRQQGQTVADLVTLCQQQHIDKIIVATPAAGQFDLRATINALRVLPNDVAILPAAPVAEIRVQNIEQIGTELLFGVQKAPIRGWGWVLKAVEDRVLALIALVLFAPVMVAAAIAIKRDSPGPVFFRQRRHGFNHRIIKIWKFRTMTVSEDGAVVTQAKKSDQRVTKVGRILRKTSIDELPQLFNVLKGEMSLVGPRPHAMAHNEYYSSQFDEYAIRHRVKPGITGWAQVNGFRGPTESAEKMRMRVEYDLYYIDNWSLWFDLDIMFRTIWVGFINDNAF